MSRKKYTTRVILTMCAFALTSMSNFATAQNTTQQDTTTAKPSANSRTRSNDAQDAAQQVAEATGIVRQMEREAGIRSFLQRAQGVFIMPKYKRAALIVGGSGSKGVLLVRQNGKWSDPAFYNTGGISAGLQAGVEAGAVALILNNQKAVDRFKRENNWSLDADAGLTVVNWSPKAEASAGRGDVIVWSDTKGLFGDLAVNITDIRFNADETAAFYGKQVALQDILSGKVRAPSRQVAALKQVLPTGAGATSSGSSGGMSREGADQTSTGK